MKVAIDCSLAVGERGGVGQYSYNLVHALSRMDKSNSYIAYVLVPAVNYILRPGSLNAGLPDSGDFKTVYKKIPVPYQLFRYFWLPGMPASLKEYMLGGLDADIIHSTTFCVPRFRDKRKKVVVTIYDVSVLTHPECHTKANISHCLKGIEDAVKYAHAIIAISNHTKEDLINYFKAPPELITVTHLAAGKDYHEVKDPEALASIKRKYGLPEDYILFVGSLEPRKNVKALIRAYSRLPEDLRKDFSLVIAGGKGWKNSDIPPLVKGLKIEDNIRFAGYIDSNDISGVYSGASLFAYPSLYEGFGLPILEAMSCGTPVITSDTSSMPEVAGDAARLIAPTNEDELADALKEVLEDKGLREEMRKKGLKQAAQFSWERCAKETLAVYRKVFENAQRANRKN